VYKVRCIAALLGLTLCTLPLDKTTAQQSEVNVVIYESARNKIGLMRYCRNNSELDPAVADKAVKALETDVRTFPLENKLAREQGDRAEKAGEDGFLEAGRRRDIASFAQLFRTTRADLCKQWAEETLRVQVTRTAAPPTAAPPVSIAAEPERASPKIARPPLKPERPDAAPRAAGLPPLPTKAPAPVKPAEPELTLLQQMMASGSSPGGNPPSPPHNWASAPPDSTEVAAFCYGQRQICRKICALRFRNDLVGCPQICESRVIRCNRTACFKWSDSEFLIAEKFGGYQCYR
jgi:hypothetical protein